MNRSLSIDVKKDRNQKKETKEERNKNHERKTRCGYTQSLPPHRRNTLIAATSERQHHY